MQRKLVLRAAELGILFSKGPEKTVLWELGSQAKHPPLHSFSVPNITDAHTILHVTSGQLSVLFLSCMRILEAGVHFRRSEYSC